MRPVPKIIKNQKKDSIMVKWDGVRGGLWKLKHGVDWSFEKLRNGFEKVSDTLLPEPKDSPYFEGMCDHPSCHDGVRWIYLKAHHDTDLEIIEVQQPIMAQFFSWEGVCAFANYFWKLLSHPIKTCREERENNRIRWEMLAEKSEGRVWRTGLKVCHEHRGHGKEPNPWTRAQVDKLPFSIPIEGP